MMNAMQKIEKFPLLYSFAEEALLEEIKAEEEKNPRSSNANRIADEFLKYIKSIEFHFSYNKAKRVNEEVFKAFESGKEKNSKDEAMRHFLQAISFNFVTHLIFRASNKLPKYSPKQ